jgi:effector-binding domain-containing protein
MRRISIIALVIALAVFTAHSAIAQEEKAEKKPTQEKTAEVPKDTPVQIKEIEPFMYCALEMKGSYDQHGIAFNNLYAVAGSQRLPLDRAPFGIYFSDPATTPEEELKWEVGFKLDEGTEVKRPLVAKQWEHTKLATKVYTGPFTEEAMGAVYGEMMGWIKDNGYFVCGPAIEYYLSEPEIDSEGGMSGTVEISFPVIESKKQKPE